MKPAQPPAIMAAPSRLSRCDANCGSLAAGPQQGLHIIRPAPHLPQSPHIIRGIGSAPQLLPNRQQAPRQAPAGCLPTPPARLASGEKAHEPAGRCRRPPERGQRAPRLSLGCRRCLWAACRPAPDPARPSGSARGWPSAGTARPTQHPPPLTRRRRGPQLCPQAVLSPTARSRGHEAEAAAARASLQPTVKPGVIRRQARGAAVAKEPHRARGGAAAAPPSARCPA